MTSKLLGSAIGILALLAGAITYVAHARDGGAAENAVPVVTGQPMRFDGKTLFFRNLAEGPDAGKLAAVPMADPGAARRVGELRCDRFAAAHGTAICLRLKAGSLPAMTDLIVLDASLHERHRETLPGTPSRARVSPDGRFVNWTLFVTGDSYAATGFSTRTGLYEVDTGRLVKTIEELAVFVDGKRYFASDVNYWGITFAADGNRFYVTMASKGKTYLIEADYRAYRGTAIAENVECPSLSPDGRRIAYKQKVADGVWRLAVLDLGTRRITHPPDSRPIDDQPVWQGNDTLLYPLRNSGNTLDVWSVGITTPAKLLIPQATSPSFS
ncbi:WD40 repeat protein [Kribbella sp. VKM Ac-2571]|uniref:TolB family protein n=1 Tax=Kribbella sp. VKM Ac-2571 TaxID=2512222 RepID=UPI00105D7437|nr:PD40 domain-containing protein [Kribbella sp. VKM Ac-2571]TDO56819.1 WD40 repeat protein [Kribbella sp. VKM Ac-2571]